MILLDANLLLYAYNSSSSQHARAKVYFEALLSGTEEVGFAWVVLLAFLRISTNHRALPQPLDPSEARAIVTSWLNQPNAVIVQPDRGHWSILDALLREAGVAGNLTTDAHLAALAIENSATLASCDADFSMFQRRGLRWVNPLATDPV